MSKLNTDPLCSMRMFPDKSSEFNHSDKEFDEVLEDGLKLNDQVIQLKKQIEVQEQDNLALIERNRLLDAENSQLKAMAASEAKDKAKKVIRDLQEIRDSYNIGTDGRNITQQAINFVMRQFDIDMFEVPCEFKTEAEDMVNQPSHYQVNEKECIVEMLILFGTDDFIKYCTINAWKYRYRAGNKGDATEDMKKADRYIEYAYRASRIELWNISPAKLTDDEWWASRVANDNTY